MGAPGIRGSSMGIVRESLRRLRMPVYVFARRVEHRRGVAMT